MYRKIPAQGKLPIIRDSKEFDAAQVVAQYANIKNLQTTNINLRGWMMDILNCVNSLKEIFTLQDVYKFAEQLKLKHAYNHNVEAKIRQQLQFLRDKGFIEFVGRGVYRKVI